jgi:hypothetical protein
LLQKLAESCVSPVFETSESCKILQNIAIPDRETGLIKALQADAAKKNRAGSINLTFCGQTVLKAARCGPSHMFTLPRISDLWKDIVVDYSPSIAAWRGLDRLARVDPGSEPPCAAAPASHLGREGRHH